MQALMAGEMLDPTTMVYRASEVDALLATLRAAPASAPEPSERFEVMGYEGSWAEDAPHENGTYMCKCCHCGRTFIGHKRRVTCKFCASAPPVPAAAPAVEPTELQRQVRDLTDTELGTLLAPYEAKNFSGLLKKVRALINAALPASPEPATLTTAARAAATSLDTLVRYHGVSQRPTPEEIRTALDALHALREALR